MDWNMTYTKKNRKDNNIKMAGKIKDYWSKLKL